MPWKIFSTDCIGLAISLSLSVAVRRPYAYVYVCDLALSSTNARMHTTFFSVEDKNFSTRRWMRRGKRDARANTHTHKHGSHSAKQMPFIYLIFRVRNKWKSKTREKKIIMEFSFIANAWRSMPMGVEKSSFVETSDRNAHSQVHDAESYAQIEE